MIHCIFVATAKFTFTVLMTSRKCESFVVEMYATCASFKNNPTFGQMRENLRVRGRISYKVCMF
jgi:hypothetical protein